MSHLGHKKLADIHRKTDALKTSHCLVRILAKRHNWAIFLRKWARSGRYSQCRSLSGRVERKIHKNLKRGYWQHLVLTRRRAMCHRAEDTLNVLSPFWRFKEQYSWSQRWNTAVHNHNNMFKNWTDRVGHSVTQPRQTFVWNYFPLITGRIELSNKKKKFEKIFRYFLKQ